MKQNILIFAVIKQNLDNRIFDEHSKIPNIILQEDNSYIPQFFISFKSSFLSPKLLP